FKIDCNINSKRPIRNCITQNTILEILELATLSPPVHLQQCFLAKTRKMRDIDNILLPQFESALADMERTIRWLQDPDERELLADVLLCDTRIHKLKTKIKMLDEFFIRHEVPLLEIQHKEQVDMQHMVIGQKRTVEICHQETRAINDHTEKLRVLEFLAKEFLKPEVFKVLIDAEVYIGDTAQCIKKVQKVYTELARKDLSASTITTEE
ncbi:hypothetical protein CPB97_001019, partial [Podila verticillata]